MSTRLRGVWTLMTQRNRRRRGVTLVELLTTVVIIGITVTFASGRLFDASDEQALRSQTRSFSRLLALARSEAIASRAFAVLAIELQAYPEPDHIRVLKNAKWDTDVGRWVGEPPIGMDTYRVEEPNDLRSITVGNTSFYVGSHAIAFSPTGAAGFDDGSVIDQINVDIVRMDD